MERLIDPKTFRLELDELDCIDKFGYVILPITKLNIALERSTVDAVPVCRCENCDMWNEEDFSGRKSLGNYRCACSVWSNFEDGRRVYTGPDEFCSRGGRKGGDEQ